MKIASFSEGNRISWGIVEGGDIVDIGNLCRYKDLKSALESNELLNIVRREFGSAERIPLAKIEWLPVIPNPNKILCVGLNFVSHREEAGRTPTDYPVIFTRFADTQTGHLGRIVRPRVSVALDYEGELAVIIGRHGRHIPRSDAFKYIAGYSCYNEGTVRDWQRHTHQFAPGKNFPSTGAFGPWMVTSDEIKDVSKLRITTRINGKLVQDATLDQLIFGIDEIIEYCSRFTPLSPGDVIATGTPGGVGFKRQPPTFLTPGDKTEVEISKIGKLINSVIDE